MSRRKVSLCSRLQRERPKSTGDSEENHHFIWHPGPSCVAKRLREHFKSKQGVNLMHTLERIAPWSRCTVSLRSRRQRERPRSTGDSEENHHFIWHLDPSCVAKRSRDHFKSKQGVHLMPTLERNAPWSRQAVTLCSCRHSAKDRNRRVILREITTLFGTSVPPALPNDHENTSKASRAFTLCPHLSEMRLGAGVQLAFVLVDSAKDRNRRF